LIQPAALGGLFIGILSALPVIEIGNYCCCLWIVSGGFLAAYLDQDPLRRRSIARGAADGFLAGVIGAFVWLLATVVLEPVTAPLQEQMIQRLLEGPIELPPEVRIAIEQNRGAGSRALGMMVGFVMHLMAGMIFATAGGLLGASLLWRDNVPPALGGPPPLPPQ